MEYRKEHGSNTWHFCQDCSEWPTTSYNSRAGEPANAKLCDQCRSLNVSGSCRKNCVVGDHDTRRPDANPA